jgi:hypothetical protein
MAGRRTALIVANDEYEHEGLKHLRSPGADASALADVLENRQISDFDVHVVHNESAHVVQGRIEDLFLDSRPDDVVLLHFSCHGLKSESGELYFATRNTRPDRLRSTAVSADYVQRCMRASRSRSVVLLLDCCYGGAFGEGVAVRAAGDVNVLDSFSGGRGRAVITASSSMEYAFEGDRLADDHAPQPSVFTSALVEGISTGAADRDEDGLISLTELYEYVFERVRERNPNQTPSRDIEMQGELYLARSKRRRIRPLPMPPDLQAATTDSNMFTRLGAVGELRARLASDNLQVAMGAHAALTEMARTDIQNVVEAAVRALGDVAVRPSESEVGFGPAGGGTVSIRLLGPPLARSCTFETAQEWIRLTETSAGVEVSVDPVVGVRRGEIVIKGPAGELAVPVVAELSPPPEPASAQAPQPEPAVLAEPVSEPVQAAVSEPEPAVDGPPGPPAATPPEQAAVTPPEHAPAPTAAPTAARPAPANSRLITIAGVLGIAASLVVLAGLFFEYDSSEWFLRNAQYLGWYLIGIAVVAFAAGVAALQPDSGAVIGPGALCGVAAACTAGSAYFLPQALGDADWNYPALWVELCGHLLLLGAAGVAIVAVRKAAAVGSELRLSNWRAWSVLGLGALGALLLFTWSYPMSSYADRFLVLRVIAVAVALAVPIASLFLPRRFRLALLVGWTAGAACIGISMLAVVGYVQMSATSTLLFLCTLPILLLLAGTDRAAAQP